MIKLLFLLIIFGAVVYFLKKTITVKLFTIDIQDNQPLKKDKEIDITHQSKVLSEDLKNKN